MFDKQYQLEGMACSIIHKQLDNNMFSPKCEKFVRELRSDVSKTVTRFLICMVAAPRLCNVGGRYLYLVCLERNKMALFDIKSFVYRHRSRKNRCDF